jgi:hypothetical protein
MVSTPSCLAKHAEARQRLPRCYPHCVGRPATGAPRPDAQWRHGKNVIAGSTAATQTRRPGRAREESEGHLWVHHRDRRNRHPRHQRGGTLSQGPESGRARLANRVAVCARAGRSAAGVDVARRGGQLRTSSSSSSGSGSTGFFFPFLRFPAAFGIPRGPRTAGRARTKTAESWSGLASENHGIHPLGGLWGHFPLPSSDSIFFCQQGQDAKFSITAPHVAPRRPATTCRHATAAAKVSIATSGGGPTKQIYPDSRGEM